MKILLPFAIIGTAIMNFASSNPIQAADMETRNGQPAWVIQSDQIELAVTELGGHMAPVTFYRKDPSTVHPYHISPWQGETHNYPVPVLEW